MLVGIAPVNWLDCKYSCLSDFKAPMSVGIVPVNEFEFRWSCSKFVSALTVDGIDPEKELENKCRYFNDVNWPTLDGIVEWMELDWTSSNVKLPKLPIEFGRVPDSPFDLKLISRTLAKLEVPGILPHVTPSKEHQAGCVVKRVRWAAFDWSATNFRRLSSSSWRRPGNAQVVFPCDSSGNNNCEDSYYDICE